MIAPPPCACRLRGGSAVLDAQHGAGGVLIRREGQGSVVARAFQRSELIFDRRGIDPRNAVQKCENQGLSDALAIHQFPARRFNR
jgi:hypothetical protein